MQHSPRFLNLVNDAKGRVKEITIDTLKSWLDDNENILLIDVRENNEWQAGHIPGAMHLGKGIIERDIEKILPEPTRKIVLYCGGGYRSILAADNLQKMGYEQVYSMTGGMRQWQGHGFPLSG